MLAHDGRWARWVSAIRSICPPSEWTATIRTTASTITTSSSSSRVIWMTSLGYLIGYCDGSIRGTTSALWRVTSMSSNKSPLQSNSIIIISSVLPFVIVVTHSLPSTLLQVALFTEPLPACHKKRRKEEMLALRMTTPLPLLLLIGCNSVFNTPLGPNSAPSYSFDVTKQ